MTSPEIVELLDAIEENAGAGLQALPPLTPESARILAEWLLGGDELDDRFRIYLAILVMGSVKRAKGRPRSKATSDRHEQIATWVLVNEHSRYPKRDAAVRSAMARFRVKERVVRTALAELAADTKRSADLDKFLDWLPATTRNPDAPRPPLHEIMDIPAIDSSCISDLE